MKYKAQTRKEFKQQLKENANISEDGMSYDEIAEILGITKAQVRKIEKDALRKLQAPTPKNKKFGCYAGRSYSECNL